VYDIPEGTEVISCYWLTKKWKGADGPCRMHDEYRAEFMKPFKAQLREKFVDGGAHFVLEEIYEDTIEETVFAVCKDLFYHDMNVDKVAHGYIRLEVRAMEGEWHETKRDDSFLDVLRSVHRDDDVKMRESERMNYAVTLACTIRYFCTMAHLSKNNNQRVDVIAFISRLGLGQSESLFQKERDGWVEIIQKNLLDSMDGLLYYEKLNWLNFSQLNRIVEGGVGSFEKRFSKIQSILAPHICSYVMICNPEIQEIAAKAFDCLSVQYVMHLMDTHPNPCLVAFAYNYLTGGGNFANMKLYDDDISSFLPSSIKQHDVVGKYGVLNLSYHGTGIDSSVGHMQYTIVGTEKWREILDDFVTYLPCERCGLNQCDGCSRRRKQATVVLDYEDFVIKLDEESTPDDAAQMEMHLNLMLSHKYTPSRLWVIDHVRCTGLVVVTSIDYKWHILAPEKDAAFDEFDDEEGELANNFLIQIIRKTGPLKICCVSAPQACTFELNEKKRDVNFPSPNDLRIICAACNEDNPLAAWKRWFTDSLYKSILVLPETLDERPTLKMMEYDEEWSETRASRASLFEETKTVYIPNVLIHGVICTITHERTGECASRKKQPNPYFEKLFGHCYPSFMPTPVGLVTISPSTPETWYDGWEVVECDQLVFRHFMTKEIASMKFHSMWLYRNVVDPKSYFRSEGILVKTKGHEKVWSDNAADKGKKLIGKDECPGFLKFWNKMPQNPREALEFYLKNDGDLRDKHRSYDLTGGKNGFIDIMQLTRPFADLSEPSISSLSAFVSGEMGYETLNPSYNTHVNLMSISMVKSMIDIHIEAVNTKLDVSKISWEYALKTLMVQKSRLRTLDGDEREMPVYKKRAYTINELLDHDTIFLEVMFTALKTTLKTKKDGSTMIWEHDSPWGEQKSVGKLFHNLRVSDEPQLLGDSLKTSVCLARRAMCPQIKNEVTCERIFDVWAEVERIADMDPDRKSVEYMEFVKNTEELFLHMLVSVCRADRLESNDSCKNVSMVHMDMLKANNRIHTDMFDEKNEEKFSDMRREWLLACDPLGPKTHSDRMKEKKEKEILGESLHYIIKSTQPQRANKITGMLLELPVRAIRCMLREQDLLNRTVNEAMRVLKEDKNKDYTDDLILTHVTRDESLIKKMFEKYGTDANATITQLLVTLTCELYCMNPMLIASHEYMLTDRMNLLWTKFGTQMKVGSGIARSFYLTLKDDQALNLKNALNNRLCTYKQENEIRSFKQRVKDAMTFDRGFVSPSAFCQPEPRSPLELLTRELELLKFENSNFEKTEAGKEAGKRRLTTQDYTNGMTEQIAVRWKDLSLESKKQKFFGGIREFCILVTAGRQVEEERKALAMANSWQTIIIHSNMLMKAAQDGEKDYYESKIEQLKRLKKINFSTTTFKHKNFEIVTCDFINVQLKNADAIFNTPKTCLSPIKIDNIIGAQQTQISPKKHVSSDEEDDPETKRQRKRRNRRDEEKRLREKKAEEKAQEQDRQQWQRNREMFEMLFRQDAVVVTERKTLSPMERFGLLLRRRLALKFMEGIRKLRKRAPRITKRFSPSPSLR